MKKSGNNPRSACLMARKPNNSKSFNQQIPFVDVACRNAKIERRSGYMTRADRVS
jgi:hypothetical protein